jgi:hypothetical protein
MLLCLNQALMADDGDGTMSLEELLHVQHLFSAQVRYSYAYIIHFCRRLETIC